MTTSVNITLERNGGTVTWAIDGQTDQKKTMQLILRLKPATRWNQVYNRMQKGANAMAGKGKIPVRAGVWYEGTAKGWDNGLETAKVEGYMQPGEMMVGVGDTAG